MSPVHVRLTLEYDGGPFHGWSRQHDVPTIEGALLAAARRIGLRDVTARCAGRTDAGVHATAQVVSITYTGKIPAERLALALNQHLPPEIGALDAVPCSADFDARTDALARAYEYRVLASAVRAPLRAHQLLHHPRRLDRALLDAAAGLVLGRHDFTAFTPHRTLHRFFHRTVLESRWEQRGDELVYCIAANAFLRHMVRVLVGNMLAVGRGDWALEDFAALLAGATRTEAHNTAPPHALCLVRVDYPPGTLPGPSSE